MNSDESWWSSNGTEKAHTVDGWNPAPVDMKFILLFTRFYTSQVVQDFSHQQYNIEVNTESQT